MPRQHHLAAYEFFIKAQSLRWRLILRLVILQISVSTAVLLGACIVIAASGGIVDENGEISAQVVGDALDHEHAGRHPSTNQQSPMVSKCGPCTLVHCSRRERRGAQARRSPAGVRGYCDGLEWAQALFPRLGRSERGKPAARFERTESEIGPVNLVIKAGAPISLVDKLKWRAAAFLLLVAPTAPVASLVVVFGTP